MVYHQTKTVKGRKYHYIIKNVRAGPNSWKKFQKYVGSGRLPKHRIDALIKKHTPALEKEADGYLRSKDRIYAILSYGELRELERIREEYNRAIKGGKILDYASFEEDFITTFTYDTNAIEGSSLSIHEVSTILYDGVVPEGANLREVHEAENHRQAFEFMKGHKGSLSKAFILQLHKRLMHNILPAAGKIRKMQVRIRGEPTLPPPPGEVEPMLNELLKWYRDNKRLYNPVILAAYMHVAFEGIHPFRDGNGRTGRLLINFILLKNKYPLVNIRNKDRLAYIQAIVKGREGDLRPMVDLLLRGIRSNAIVELCAQKRRKS